VLILTVTRGRCDLLCLFWWLRAASFCSAWHHSSKK